MVTDVPADPILGEMLDTDKASSTVNDMLLVVTPPTVTLRGLVPMVALEGTEILIEVSLQ
jgi:hypothetical protein